MPEGPVVGGKGDVDFAVLRDAHGDRGKAHASAVAGEHRVDQNLAGIGLNNRELG